MAGRPPFEINEEILNTMLEYGATCLDCAGRFNCSEDSIQRWVKKHKNMNFAMYSDKMMHKVRMKLRQKMYETAMNGNVTMQIWLSKQWLGMVDQPKEDSIKEPITVIIK